MNNGPRDVAKTAFLSRILRGILTVWAVVTLTFVTFNVLPSDPARLVAGPQARPEDVARIRVEIGANLPPVARYARFLGRLIHLGPKADASEREGHRDCTMLGRLHLDLGRSYTQRRAVLTVLAERLPRTAMLAAMALLFQVLFGVLSGVFAARYAGSLLERVIVRGSLLGVSVPTFLIGLGLQYVFAHRLHWFPLDGFGQTASEHVLSTVLPALTLGIYGFAYYTRLTRDEVGRELLADYIRTARAKGASEARVLWVHALRNAVLPLVTLVGLDLAALLGGAVVTETLFRFPGLGLLSSTALFDRDAPILLGTVLVASLTVTIATLATDLLVRVADPRTK